MNADSRRHALLAVVAVLCALVVPSCYQVTGYDKQPRMTRAPYMDRAAVYVHWVSDVDEIVRAGHCKPEAGKIVAGCADLLEITPTDWRCDVYAQQPTDFNDVARLAVLGHELLHCVGARHDGVAP